MGGRAVAEGRTVEQQVLESNPVPEAFGNAKIVRNNNSRCFGKFVEIQFDRKGRISGAAIRTYLLERSCVCQLSDPEKNYHCFYMLCSAPPEDVHKYKLGHPSTFHYLNQSNSYKLDGLDESKEYTATRRAMDIVGISSDEQDAMFRVYKTGVTAAEAIDANGSNFPGGVTNDGKFWIDLSSDDQKDKVKQGNMESAKLYVHVKPALGGTFTDIVMWVFCPFKGPANIKVELMSISFSKIGEHVGEWEHFSLRICNYTGELWSIYFSQHSGGDWVDAYNMEYSYYNLEYFEKRFC